MSQKITHDQKETALEAIKEQGTMNAGAKAASISIRTLNQEMKRSAVFRKRLLEARAEGYTRLADNARQLVIDYMMGKYAKTDRNQLTAAIALLNAYEPGFRGTTMIQGRVEHDVRVITAVPRPKYIEAPKTEVIDVRKTQKKLKVGSVEDVIEGVAVEIKDE